MWLLGFMTLFIAILSLVAAILALMGIDQLQTSVDLHRKAIGELERLAYQAMIGIDIVHHGTQKVVRGLRAGYPPEQWAEVLKELEHVQSKQGASGEGLVRFQSPGTGEAAVPETRPAERDHEQGSNV